MKKTKRQLAIAALAAISLPAGVAEGRVAFATCYNLTGITASGYPVSKRTAAHNFLRAGTKFTIYGSQAGPGGVRKYIVRDTGPALADGHFDLWNDGPCMWWGWRKIYYRLGW